MLRDEHGQDREQQECEGSQALLQLIRPDGSKAGQIQLVDAASHVTFGGGVFAATSDGSNDSGSIGPQVSIIEPNGALRATVPMKEPVAIAAGDSAFAVVDVDLETPDRFESRVLFLGESGKILGEHRLPQIPKGQPGEKIDCYSSFGDGVFVVSCLGYRRKDGVSKVKSGWTQFLEFDSSTGAVKVRRTLNDRYGFVGF